MYNSFNEFLTYIDSLETTKQKGDKFELFCKFYMKYVENVNQYYTSNEIPNEIAEKLNIYTINKDGKEKGIDAIIINNDEYYSVQCKFRSNIEDGSSYNEVSNFLYQSLSDKITKRYWITNTYDVHTDFKNADSSFNCCSITYYDFQRNCNGDFWEKFNIFLEEGLMSNIEIKPHITFDYQETIINKSYNHFNSYNKGKLIMCCGSGKTLVSYWIFNKLEYKTCIIFVPSLELLSQFFYEWKYEFNAEHIESNFLLIGSEADNINDDSFNFTISTQLNDINNFILKPMAGKKIIISTYHSANLLIESLIKNNVIFDLTIYDEAHHTCQTTDNMMYSRTIKENISHKKLFMTATEKIINFKSNSNDDEIISMDNEELYGKLISSYNFYQAIKNNRLCDYKIISPVVILENNELDDQFIIAYNILESIRNEQLQKIILYSSNQKKAKFIEDTINKLLEYENYNDIRNRIETFYIIGQTTKKQRLKLINNFKKSDIGIISSVRVFSEGINIPVCDAVCFCDIKSSETDTIQSVGRCLRKVYNCPKCNIELEKCCCLSNLEKAKYFTKIGHIIVPIILKENEEFFSNSNSSYIKLRKMLKTIGIMDKRVIDKFELKFSDSIYNFIGNSKSSNTVMVNNISKKLDDKTNIEILQKHIINQTFDRYGNIIDFTRQLLINENEVRYKNKKKLIDSRKEAIEYLQSQEYYEEPKQQNWIKYCLGAKLFDKIREKYIWDLDSLRNICHSNNIFSWNDYKDKYDKYKFDELKLPPIEYINDGYYYDLDNKFNMTKLLTEINEDMDF